MIVSASYKTDIPAFYGNWFMHRLAAGYCLVHNSYTDQPFRVSLERKDVDGFVFWTKNPGPFIEQLGRVQELGYPFVLQFTITGYPRLIESHVITAESAIALARKVGTRFGLRTVVWRYDPILFTNVITADFHRHNFQQLAMQLRGATDEVVVSEMHPYKNTMLNLEKATGQGLHWQPADEEESQALVGNLADIAAANGMRLNVCSQRRFVQAGIGDARCVDIVRLSDVANWRIKANPRGNRSECWCFESRDIGAYDSCPQGCVYCYAVSQRNMAVDGLRRHDPHSEFLLERSPAQKRHHPVLW